MSVTIPKSVLSMTNVITITLSGVPTGAIAKNVNNLAFFTTETPSNTDTYRAYVDPLSVATDYGTNSVTYAYANAVFSQNPNILSGGGQLIIIPMQAAVSGTPGTWQTADISANLANIIAVTSGRIKVTVNGTANSLTGLNFSGCATLADVAQTLQNVLTNCIVSVDTTNKKLVFTGKKVGTSSTIVVAVQTGSGTDLSGANYFNTATGTETDGVNASGESLVTAINRTLGAVSFCGVITNLRTEDAVMTVTTAAIQALDLIYVQDWSDSGDIAGIITTIQSASETKTRCLFYSGGLTNSGLFKAAYAGRLFSCDFTGSNTVSTMNLKQLAGITPDYGITQTIYNNAIIAGADLYVSYDGVASVCSNGANLYADQVYCRQALKFALQVAGFNYLATTNTKVPQTEKGMDGLTGAYRKVFNQFVTNGYLGTGLTWNSAQTFGNVADFYRNITDFGYYLYSQPIAQQNQVDRNARKAPVIQAAGKEAGALHSSNVLVVVEA